MTMQVQPYLNFDGRCEEALEFYRRALGAKIEMLMRFKDSPDPSMVTPGSEEKVMHCAGLRRAVPGPDQFPGHFADPLGGGRGRGGKAVWRPRRRRTGANAADRDLLLTALWYGRRPFRRDLDGSRRIPRGALTSGRCTKTSRTAWD